MPDEAADETLQHFYGRLLAVLRNPVLRDGTWKLCECTPAWSGNSTSDDFIAWTWQGDDGACRWVAVNYAAHRSQCYARFAADFSDVVHLRDAMGVAHYERDALALSAGGLYLDLAAWGYNVFEVTAS